MSMPVWDADVSSFFYNKDFQYFYKGKTELVWTLGDLTPAWYILSFATTRISRVGTLVLVSVILS